jgi:CubicO group peptidase (beta-lactamase class C family)
MNALLLLGLLTFAGVHAPLPDTTQRLPRSIPEQQGIASSAILAFVEAADREIDTMNSFMLVRHGHVVAEGWWAPYDAESPHVLYSLSKSFTSTAVGLAIAEGKLSLHDEVLSFFPDEAPAEPSAHLKMMRVHDLLRMSAGHEEEVRLEGDVPWTKAFLAHPVPFRPGTHFLYNTPATYMLSAIVQQVTGMTVLDYLRPRLFEPLGIDNPIWGTSPQGVTLGGYGLSIRTEDIARFGQLYLQKGVWKGQRLIPASWVEAATSLQTSNGSDPESDWHQGYGYQFWRSRHDTYRGDGAFGQYCIVIPQHDAVVAITSGVRDMQAVMNLVWDKLLPAMQEAPLPDDAPSRQQLGAKLASLTVRPALGQPTSPRAAAVSGKTYAFPENDRGIEAVTLDFDAEVPVLVVHTAEGESRIPFGTGTWEKGRASFVNGLDRFLGPPTEHAVAASGAWTADDVFTLKLCLYETPFYTTLTFRFDDDSVLLDAEHHVAFGPTQLPQLVGQAR